MTPPLFVFDLPLISQSQNTYQRAHWLDRHIMVGRYRKLIGHQLHELKELDRQTGDLDVELRLWPRAPDKGRVPARDKPERRRLLVVRHSAGELDYGNLVGGSKPLVDALVREGVLYDDSPRWLDEEYRQERIARGRGRVVVEVFGEAQDA